MMMDPEANECACAAGRKALPSSGSLTARCCLVLSVGLAALVPKCPMCLVAYLSLFGLGGGLAVSAYPWLRPMSLVLVAIAAVVVLLQQLRTRYGLALRRALARRVLAPRAAAHGPATGE
jgi:hypothetical protein